MRRATRDQVLTTLQVELEAAQKAGRGKEIEDIGVLIRHYTQRPLKETDAYIRDVRLANGRQRQRRWRGARELPGAIYPGDWVKVPGGKIFRVRAVDGPLLTLDDATTVRRIPDHMAEKVDDPVESVTAPAAPAACEVCPLVVAVADAFYHTIADVLEAGLTPASATDLQGALDAYEAAITALGL